MARKIEALMNKAIADLRSWSQDNTDVVPNIGNDNATVSVYLHGNLIAELGDNYITLYDGGWQTNTTKSRLNAILAENGVGNEHVFQRDYQWFISYDGKVEPFVSGMTI